MVSLCNYSTVINTIYPVCLSLWLYHHGYKFLSKPRVALQNVNNFTSHFRKICDILHLQLTVMKARGRISSQRLKVKQRFFKQFHMVGAFSPGRCCCKLRVEGCVQIWWHSWPCPARGCDPCAGWEPDRHLPPPEDSQARPWLSSAGIVPSFPRPALSCPPPPHQSVGRLHFPKLWLHKPSSSLSLGSAWPSSSSSSWAAFFHSPLSLSDRTTLHLPPECEVELQVWKASVFPAGHSPVYSHPSEFLRAKLPFCLRRYFGLF